MVMSRRVNTKASKKNAGGTNARSKGGRKKASTKPSIFNGSDHVGDRYSEEEILLRRFDMNMTYGPCSGMSRLARWERAHRMGLSPPREVEELLKSGKTNAGCLWNGL